MRILFSALLAVALLAGCAEAEEPELPLVTLPAAPTPVDEAIAWTATIGTGTCIQATVVVTASVCGLSGPALTSPTASASFKARFQRDADGRDLAGGLLRLEWDPASLATEGLRATVALLEDCPEECRTNRTILSTAGVSPLDLPITGHDLRQGMALSIVIMPADLAQGIAVSIGQEIRLGGTLSFVDDPDGDPPEGDEEAGETP